MDESCGKCIPCRAGTVQMHHLLVKILARQATARDLRPAGGALRHGEAHQPLRPRPDLTQPVLSTLRFFRNEYEELLQPDPHAAPPTTAKA